MFTSASASWQIKQRGSGVITSSRNRAQNVAGHGSSRYALATIKLWFYHRFFKSPV